MAQAPQAPGEQRIFQAKPCNIFTNPQAFFGTVKIYIQDSVDVFFGFFKVFLRLMSEVQDNRLILSMIPEVDLLLI